MEKETALAAMKATPPLSVGTATLFNIPLPDVLLYVTLIYTVLMIVFMIRDKLVYPWLAKRLAKTQARVYTPQTAFVGRPGHPGHPD